jgi:hypothetical protein
LKRSETGESGLTRRIAHITVHYLQTYPHFGNIWDPFQCSKRTFFLFTVLCIFSGSSLSQKKCCGTALPFTALMADSETKRKTVKIVLRINPHIYAALAMMPPLRR